MATEASSLSDLSDYDNDVIAEFESSSAFAHSQPIKLVNRASSRSTTRLRATQSELDRTEPQFQRPIPRTEAQQDDLPQLEVETDAYSHKAQVHDAEHETSQGSTAPAQSIAEVTLCNDDARTGISLGLAKADATHIEACPTSTRQEDTELSKKVESHIGIRDRDNSGGHPLNFINRSRDVIPSLPISVSTASTKQDSVTALDVDTILPGTDKNLGLDGPVQDSSGHPADALNGQDGEATQHKVKPLPFQELPQGTTSTRSRRPPAKRKAPTTEPKLIAAQRTLRKHLDDSTFLTTNPKSPLAKADIYALLSRPEAWTSLSSDQKTLLISMIPGAGAPFPLPQTEEIPNLPQQYLLTQPAIKSDIRLWKEDLVAGRLDPEWLACANAASNRRAEGFYDEFDDQRIREDWAET